ncbi:MAG: methyltransferase domain-containing protein [Candidatus Jordarchaeaceae archaeon]
MHLLPQDFQWNIVKVDVKRKKVSFLWYPHFDEDPHPSLKEWINIDLDSGKTVRRMEKENNPPILHRKETFLDKHDPRFHRFATLTAQEMEAGLYEPKFLCRIGRKKAWESFLHNKGVEIVDHNVIKRNKDVKMACQKIQSPLTLFGLVSTSQPSPTLSAKTAIHRRKASLPLKIVLERGLIKGNVFDWGCGYGKDVEYLKGMGIISEGWDPIHKPVPKPENYPPGYFQTVLCIYVINTLPNHEERMSVLRDIYNFLPLGGVLILAVRSVDEVERARTRNWRRFGDGWLTSRGTFQKGFTLEELLGMVNQFSFKTIIISKNPLVLLCQKIG